MGYDAVFIGTGAGAPSFLGIPGEFAGAVYSANEFLTRVNLMGGDRFPYQDTPVTPGRRVVVLGAGNTAMDCLRVSRRLGAADVKCVYHRTEAEAPARIEEIRHAKEEGITFHWLRSPLRIETDEAGDVKSITCQVMELGPPNKSAAAAPSRSRARRKRPCATPSFTRSGRRRSPSSRARLPASTRARRATSTRTRRRRPRTCPASSRAATSSRAAPRSSSRSARAAAPRRRS